MHDSLPEEIKLGSLLDADGQPDQIDVSNAVLQDQVEALKNKLHEERFLWILTCIFLADAYIFTQMENWTGPLVIGIIQLIGIVILADRCKVDTVAPLIDKLTGFVHRATKTD